MKVFFATSIALAFSLLPGSGSAQQASNPAFDFPAHTTPEPPDQQWNRVPERPAPEDRVIKKGVLAPAAQDRTDYAAFLKESNTGLVRLLPYQRTNERLVRGGGAYYSFKYISHQYGRGSDIQLQRPLVITSGSVPRRVLEGIHDMLSVGFAGADYGMLANLGEAPLDEINAKDPRALFLAKYEPPRSDPDARCERRRFVVGERIDGLVYKNSLPVRVGATYLLRSINYNESDVLVAFRVARQDDDGSVTIAWKLLKEFAPRKLENVNVKSKCSGPIIIKLP
ncbi:MAG TPA: hypothetical protein VK582_25220 [Pyrinomonadaceae bacterium]|nr:hypothetical protein [Pyrinomonadaceae bacterium]